MPRSDVLFAFYNDLVNRAAWRHACAQFSEFGRRISENGSQGTDHGAASVMMAIGGTVRGGIYGSTPNLRFTPDNPTLENNGNDVRYETDFRSVYAKVIDSWLGGDSSAVLGANFRTGAPPLYKITPYTAKIKQDEGEREKNKMSPFLPFSCYIFSHRQISP